MQDVNKIEKTMPGEGGYYVKTLYYLFNFSVDKKLFLNIKFINLKSR